MVGDYADAHSWTEAVVSADRTVAGGARGDRRRSIAGGGRPAADRGGELRPARRPPALAEGADTGAFSFRDGPGTPPGRHRQPRDDHRRRPARVARELRLRRLRHHPIVRRHRIPAAPRRRRRAWASPPTGRAGRRCRPTTSRPTPPAPRATPPSPSSPQRPGGERHLADLGRHGSQRRGLVLLPTTSTTATSSTADRSPAATRGPRS